MAGKHNFLLLVGWLASPISFPTRWEKFVLAIFTIFVLFNLLAEGWKKEVPRKGHWPDCLQKQLSGGVACSQRDRCLKIFRGASIVFAFRMGIVVACWRVVAGMAVGKQGNE